MSQPLPPSVLPPLPSPAPEIAAAARRWVDAFNARDPARLCALYHPDAVLWGTTAQAMISTPAGVQQYFEGHCAALHPLSVAITGQRIRQFGAVAVNSGSYTLSVQPGPQRLDRAARFSFTYQQSGADWLIVDHHSSWVPEALGDRSTPTAGAPPA